MKNLILSVLVISLISCTKNERIIDQNTKMIGTWQLIEIFESEGASNPQWTEIENGYTYTFNSDNSFISNRFLECTNGIYTVLNGILTLDFGCQNFDTGIESPAGTFIENYTFESGNLILVPEYLNCIEGCGYKFKKTTSK
ncbi:MAG: hypothetical protein L3J25_11690 [Flavobacteriaceae bacterium]|nr:hypothetical protein [Flavobacteriaceae bacterium]